MAQNRNEPARRRLVMIFVAALIALALAFVGAYLVVVSQNPASAVGGPPFVYGSPSP